MTDPYDVETGIPRDRWGRPLVVPPNGGKAVAYTRVTTYAGSVEDTYKLGQWLQRMVALGLAERPDLMVSVAAHFDDKEELNKICDTAIEAAKGRAAAGVGTALHKLTDRLDRGEDLGPVPAEYRADLHAFEQATKPLKVAGIEQFVVLDGLKVGGTFDRLYEYEGRHYIGDTKSGSIEWGAGKIAMQLAMYSRSALYDYKTKVRTPLEVDQSRGIVVHMPAGTGTCELKWVDLTAGWEAVSLATMVRAWRARKKLIYPFDPVEVVRDEFPDTEVVHKVGDTVTVGGIEFTKHSDYPFPDAEEIGPAELFMERIKSAASRAELEEMYRLNRAEWTDEHTRAAKQRTTYLHGRALRARLGATP